MEDVGDTHQANAALPRTRDTHTVARRERGSRVPWVSSRKVTAASARTPICWRTTVESETSEA